MSEALRGLLDMGAGVLKGGVQGLVGLPGDLEEWRRDVGSSPSARVFPTSKEVGEYLPSTKADTATFEKLGEQLNPVEPLKTAAIAAKIGPAAKAGLYAGALRKDLLASHDTSASGLLTQGKLPAELYNLSIGVTKDRPMEFAGDTLLIPHQGAFDPKTSPSTLHAFDAYTPRRQQAQGKRADALMAQLRDVKDAKELEQAAPPMTEQGRRLFEDLLNKQGVVAHEANKRLVDRFISQHPKGGRLTEGSGMPPPVHGLPVVGRGGYRGADVMIDAKPEVAQMASYGPRFQSFKHYESSPYGAGRLDTGPDVQETYNRMNAFLQVNAKRAKDLVGANVDKYPNVTDEPEMMKAIKELAGMKVDMQHSSASKLMMRAQAQRLMEELRKTKSDYGELKVFGPVGMHNDNFAGIIANLDAFDYGSGKETFKRLKEAAKARNIPFEAYNRGRQGPEEGFKIAKQMQELRQKGGGSFKDPNPGNWGEEWGPAPVVEPLKPSWHSMLTDEHVVKAGKKINIFKLKDKLNQPETQIKDLSETELNWAIDNMPEHPMFDNDPTQNPALLPSPSLEEMLEFLGPKKK